MIGKVFIQNIKSLLNRTDLLEKFYINQCDLIDKSNSTYKTISYQRTTSELVSTVPITTGSPFTFTTVYRLQIPEIKTGDLLTIHGNGECRINNDYNCQVTSGIYLTPSSTFSIFDPNLVTVDNGRGYNITLTVHYGNFPKSCTYQATQNYNGYYLHYVWWFASTSAGGGDLMDVMSGYGFLDCELKRI